MKLSLISTLLATLALKSVTANPVPEPHPQKFKIGESSLGPVYSNVDPNQHQRRDLSSDISKRNPLPQQRYKIGESELGPVYSTVDPNQHQRRDVDTELVARDSAYTPVTQDEAAQYIKEKQVFSFLTFDLIENRMTNPFVSGIQSDPSHNKRNNLQKRTYADCVACVAACGLMQQGISALSVSQQVQFCLGNCVLQGACTPYFRARYGDQYDNSFPP